jgi:chromosome segregation ATPase
MIIYVLIVLVGSLIAAKLIWGELRKERRDYVLITKPAVEASVSKSSEPVPISIEEFKEVQKEFISPAAYTPFVKVETQTEQLENWERILAGKNAEIERLTRDLGAQKYQTQEFEKIKALLERQIFESRQMNREIKRELDLLKAQGQKSQDEITKLQMELNYKNQLINQSEVRMSELKNRISQMLPNTPASNEPASEPVQKQDLGDFSFDQLDWRKKLND